MYFCMIVLSILRYFLHCKYEISRTTLSFPWHFGIYYTLFCITISDVTESIFFNVAMVSPYSAQPASFTVCEVSIIKDKAN